VFYLRRNEVTDVLWDLYQLMGRRGGRPRPSRWPAEVRRRRDILRALEGHPPPPALGIPPERITEPFTIMLWGITEDSIAQWLPAVGGAEPGVLTGMAASPGVVEGPARVIASFAQIDQVRDGEIPGGQLTSPSWAADLRKDPGHRDDHRAESCRTRRDRVREYGLPAVTGTASGTTRIRTGQRIRVDGDTGKVTILDDGVPARQQ